MAKDLKREAKVQAVGLLSEGGSIRSTEPITGVHRDTIVRRGVRVGEACAGIQGEKCRNLDCHRVEVDEICGFVGRKNERTTPRERNTGLGDVWAFIALDAGTKLIPSFVVGKWDAYHAKAFNEDLASRMKSRGQLSSGAMGAYADAVEVCFGCEVEAVELTGDPKAMRCCAWSHLDGVNDERARLGAVLETGSAVTAVRVQIVKDAKHSRNQ